MINDQPVPNNTITAAMTSDQRIVTVVGPKTGLQLVYPGIPHTNNDAILRNFSLLILWPSEHNPIIRIDPTMIIDSMVTTG